MISRFKFDPCHLEKIDPSSIFAAEPVSFENFASFKDYDRAWTICDTKEKKILGCVGGIELWKGVAECWCYFDKNVDLYPVGLTKEILSLLELMQGEHKIHRIQAHIRADQPRALRWAEMLGFESEGFLKSFGIDKSDYHLMARVKLEVRA